MTRCPACGQSDYRVLAAALTNSDVYRKRPLTLTKEFACNSCGHRWKERRETE